MKTILEENRIPAKPVLENQQSSLFLWGASLTSTPYITSTYKKGTAQTPKSTILPRTVRNMFFFTFPTVFHRISSNQIQNLSSKSFFTEDVVEAEVSPDEDPLRLPSLSFTQTTHRLATEHLQVNHHDHADVGNDDYIDGDGDCAKILVFVLVIYVKRIVSVCGHGDGDANIIDFYRTCIL